MSKKKKTQNVLRNRQTVVQAIKKATNETIVINEKKDSKVSYFEIDAIKKTQKGIDYFSGEFSLAQLAALTHVDNYDGDRADKEGAGQRILSEARARQFMDFIVDRDNVCFLEILINDRERKSEFTSIQQLGITIPQHAKLAARHGILRIPSEARLYVYDGQTRRFGYLSLLHFDLEMLGTEAYKDYQHMKIPFCLCQVSAREETKLFMSHNRQTTVANDHKAMISWHAYKDMTTMKDHSIHERTRSIIAGMTYIMNRDRTNPWYNRICMPDYSIEENKKRLGSQGSFNTGLKRFVDWLQKNYWSPETSFEEKSQDIAEICTIFWRSMQKVCPKIWKNPEEYVQLKSLGISSLSLLLHTLYVEFFDRNIEWNIENISVYLKKSNIITTPKKWIIGGELFKRGGSYNSLRSIERDIYDQIKKN